MEIIGNLLQCSLLRRKGSSQQNILENITLTNIEFYVWRLMTNILLDFMADMVQHLTPLD